MCYIEQNRPHGAYSLGEEADFKQIIAQKILTTNSMAHEKEQNSGRESITFYFTWVLYFLKIADKYPLSCVMLKPKWTNFTMATKSGSKIRIQFYFQVGLGIEDGLSLNYISYLLGAV